MNWRTGQEKIFNLKHKRKKRKKIQKRSQENLDDDDKKSNIHVIQVIEGKEID